MSSQFIPEVYFDHQTIVFELFLTHVRSSEKESFNVTVCELYKLISLLASSSSCEDNLALVSITWLYVLPQ